MSETKVSELSIIYYDKADYVINANASIEDCRACREKAGVTWINVDSVKDLGLLQSIGSIFNLHELTIQDVTNTEHRVKHEDFGHYLLVILKMLEFNRADKSILTEQLSIVFGKNYLVTFQETPGDFFGDLRDEIKIADSVVRKMGPDFLACRIIDTIVDNYFNTVESFGDQIEEKEDELVVNPTRGTLFSIQGIKKNMMQLRQYIWPAREILSDLCKKELAPHQGGNGSLLPRRLRPHLRGHGPDRKHTRYGERPDRYLPVEHEQQDQRGNEGTDRGGNHIHTADLHRGPLRHELQIYAGVGHRVGLPGHPDIDGHGGRGHARLFP